MEPKRRTRKERERLGAWKSLAVRLSSRRPDTAGRVSSVGHSKAMAFALRRSADPASLQVCASAVEAAVFARARRKRRTALANKKLELAKVAAGSLFVLDAPATTSEADPSKAAATAARVTLATFGRMATRRRSRKQSNNDKPAALTVRGGGATLKPVSDDTQAPPKNKLKSVAPVK